MLGTLRASTIVENGREEASGYTGRNPDMCMHACPEAKLSKRVYAGQLAPTDCPSAKGAHVRGQASASLTPK